MTKRERVEGPCPPSLHRAGRSGLRRRAVCVLTVLALAELGSAYAACVPAGSPHGDIIVCSGSQSEAVAAQSGDDSIRILPGASVNVTAARSATAVDAGAGNDSVVNEGIVSVTVTPPALAPAATSSCSAYWNDRYGASTVLGIGIAGGGGIDLIDNRGTITVQTTVAGGSGAVKPSAASIGILGDSGNDRISNGGSMTVSASSDASSPQATAKGIVGGNGDDLIVNTGTIAVTASATVTSSAQSAAPVSSLSKGSHDSKPKDDSQTASATAVGIEGGSGKDRIDNVGTLNVSASASINSFTPSLTLSGGDDVDASTTLDARAVGIAAGSGRDQITNNRAVRASATAAVDNVGVEVNLIDLSHANTNTTVSSTATGIDGGSGSDKVGIGNTGRVDATANSSSKSVAVEANLVDAAVSDATLTVNSRATGIDAGTGHDHVDNAGSVKASATSSVTDVGVNASFVDATVAEGRGSNLSTTLNATAVGIDSRKGKDDIEVTSTGSVGATAASTAHSVGVSLASEGVPGPTVTLFRDGGLASIGITSNSDATGIATGDSNDRVSTAGDVIANATSTARQESINVGVALLDFHIPTPGIVLGSAGTGAHATATGIATGAGGDEITNSAHVDVDAVATASATTVSVNIAEFSTDLAENFPSGPPIGASLVVADTATQATAKATGIDAGSGNDVVKNTNLVESTANATSGSTSVSVTTDVKYKEGANFFAADAVGARSTTNADATAIGIDGGSGRNTIDNSGHVAASATADGNTVSVGVVVSGSLQGNGGALNLAATDTSTTGTAAATGIKGGAGQDNITNSGTVEATTNADVGGVNVSVTATIAQTGLVAGAALSRSVSESHATSVGIDGGGGADEIENTGTITSTATANAAAVAVSVNINGAKQGVAGGAALADTQTTASATAVGIKAGNASEGKDSDHESNDHQDYGSKHYDDKNGSITNANAITVDAEADTVNVSTSIKATVAKEGVAIGAALADSRSTSQATAKGIEGNSDANEISNTGTIAVKSDASSTAASVSVTVEGTATGLAAGAALVRADVNATSNAAGIDGGAGDDRLSNDGTITFEKSKSTAIAVGVAPNVVAAKSGAAIGGALADTRASASSTATALDGGAGDDKLTNRGAIALNSTTADSNAVSVTANIALSQTGFAAGAALARSDNTATALAQGLNGGSGDDVLLNTGSIKLTTTTADADAVSVSIGVSGAQTGVALSGALVDAHAKADATGLGMAGGDGKDVLVSTNSVTVDDVHASSASVGVGVGMSFSENGVAVGAALAKTGTEANATGKALDGGDGKDFLYAEGNLTVQNVKADATAVSVSVSATGAVNGLAIGAGLADASGKATASASGLDGGADDDAIVNRAKVNVQDVNANATAVGVTVELAGTSAGVAAGVTLVNSSGTATATAKGIDGGTGDDALWNKEAITVQRVNAHANAVSAAVSIGVAVSGGVAGGAALSNASATANANASGMDGGSGNDAIGNVSSITLTDITSNTNAVGVSVQLGVTTAGVALGAALADTSTTANTTAKGMDGGAGDDVLYNGGQISLNQIKADANAVSVGVTGNLAVTGGVAAGAALTRGGGTANVTAIGMDGGSGRDTLVNTGSITVQDAEADAHATGVSVSANVSLAGGAGGAALTDTTGTARTVVKGIDGGADDDTIYNKGSIDVHGKSKADATGVDVSVTVAPGVGGGAQVADVSTTSETTAMGIDGGSGRNTVGNEGSVNATADADSQSTAVGIGFTVAFGGDATLVGATSTATASAIGINDAGDGQAVAMHSTKPGDGDHEERVNEMANSGAVTATATATSKGVTVSGNLVGYALGKTTNTATANATGIKTGDARDAIRNEGAITAISSATVSGLSIAVSLAGKAMGDASSIATATATGIDTGAGDDRITNHSTITVSAGKTDVADGATSCNANAGGACARVSSVSVNLAGVGTINASTTASATATGIAAGADDDTIDSDGAIDVSAHAKTGAGGTNLNIAGATSTNVTTIASATATGIAGEDGNDVIRSASRITAKASSDSVVNNTSVTIAGAGGFDATLSANARATAIDGGAGDDKIYNKATLSATAAATLNSGGGSNVIFGASGADSQSGAFTDAAGIRGGANDDFIWNEGSIDTHSNVSLSLGNSSFTFGGAGAAAGTLTATSRSTGIAGDDGHDVIVSSNAITVDAQSLLNASGGSTVIFGASSGGATSGASTTAIGIDGGAQGDGILVDGSLTVTAGSQLTLSGSSFTFGGASGEGGSLSASTLSIGVAGGTGADTIGNKGIVSARAESTLNASGSSNVAFGHSTGGANAGAITDARGIDGGDDDDFIHNSGTVKAKATATLTLSGGSFAFGGASGTQGSLTATTRSTGIAGGTGADTIGNKGIVSARAESNLNASGSSNVAFGASTGGANAGAIADARGIDGGDDDDFIHNSGTVKAKATATLTLSGGSFAFGGAGGTQGSLTATTRSTGIAGGAGQDIIKNEGEIHARNTSTLNSSGGSTVVFGSSGASSSAGAVAITTGIDGGNGDDFVWNSGSIFVNSTADLTLGGSSYTFGGTGNVGGRLNATTNSAGIQGGNGNDFIGNEGSIAVEASSTLTSSASVNTTFGTSASGAVVGSDIGAAGIDGGAGDDVIKNLGTVTAKANASVDPSSSSYVFGGATSTNIVAQAGANSAGLRGGDGNDFIFNSGDVTAEATSTATSTSSSKAEFGGSTSRGEIAASLIARGVDGGAGDDIVVNSGTITAIGTSNVSSSANASTGILFGDGNSVASGSTTLSVFGIDAGDGNNTVVNKGTVKVDLFGSALVQTTSDGGGILDGDAFSRSDSTLTATAIGIRTGDGNDVIVNKDSVDIKTWRRFTLFGVVLDLPTGAGADANANGNGIDGDGTIRSFATTNLTAVGIDAGNGNNRVENHGTITIDARAAASATGTVDADAGGTASAILEARVNANAVGIRTGSGDDTVINKGTISVTMDASNNTGSGHIVASATGIETGAGNDTIVNEGTITATNIVNGVTSPGTAISAGAGDDFIFNSGDVTAEAISTATSASSYLDSVSMTSRSEIAASLIARGVDGGAGDDIVVNSGTITAIGTSHVMSSASTDMGFLFDAAASGSTTLSVFGIDAGDGDNVVVNKGAVNVDLLGTVFVETTSTGGGILFGGNPGFSRSDSTLTATAVGIRSGDGNDVIDNKGSVDIKTWRRFTLSDLPTGAGADANADGTIHSFATTNLTAIGIDAGNGNNRVENDGTIAIDARALASATGGGASSVILEARVNANAVGIRTGSGNDTVVNKGTITVTTNASNNTGSAHIVASATGIETGAGNDTIVNQGTITATTIVNGVTSRGTAISAGAGDDVVSLTGGSVTNGNIDLGSGNNRLVLEGTPVINGTVIDGSTGLALVFNGVGSYGGALPGVSATKNGPGTFTLPTLNRMQRIEVNQGTLKLDSDYAFLDSGVFQAKVNGNGSYGQFYVNGRAALDGTMKIVRGGGAYLNGTAFDVLTAGNGIEAGTAFSRVESPDDTRLLKFHTEQLSDGVRVKADVASFTTVAGTPNQVAVARNLDRILPKATGNLNQLLGKIQVLGDGQFASAFAAMSPAVYAGYSASALNSVQQYANVLQDRMATLRAADLWPAQTAGASSGEPVRLAYTGKGLSDLLDASEAEQARSSGLWLRGFSQKGNQSATEDMGGFDYRLAGTTIGYDHRFANGFSAGASLGTVRNTVNVDSDVSQGDIDSTMGSIYAGYFDRRLYVNGVLSAGRNKYDTRRTNTLDQSTITSAHSGGVRAAAAGVGGYVPLETWWLEPFATVQFTRLKEEGFSETGSGALDIPARTTDGVFSTLGARFSRPIRDGNGAAWIPQASLAWLHDYSKNQVLNASYIGAPDSSFSIEGQKVQRNGALVGLGISYRSKGGLTSMFEYIGEFRDQFRAHTLAGELRFEY